MDSITFKKERGIPCESEENKEGYKVVYPDGYISWSPKLTFEKAYVRTCLSPFDDGKTFGEALEWVRSGEYYMSLPFWDKEKKIKMQYPKEMTEPFLYVQIGAKRVPWTPSHEELLSDEWIVD